MHELLRAWGPGRVGIKLSPSIAYNGMTDSDVRALYTHLIAALDRLPLAYLNLMQPMFPLDDFPT